MSASRFITLARASTRSLLASDLVVAGDLGFVSGVRAVDLGNDRVPLAENVEAQTEKIFSNLDVILHAAGLERRHLVSVRIHLVEFERLFERMNKAYISCIGAASLPARTCVGVTHLTRGAQVEMDFVVRMTV